MTSHISSFLRTELTPVPSLLEKILGKYYNNALCNGATWVFLLWCLVHTIFNGCLQALLRRMGHREYVRARLLKLLWYLGFYTVACAYAAAAMWRSDISLFSFNLKGDVEPSSLVLGYVLLTMFFLHSVLWEGLNNRCVVGALTYLGVFVLFVGIYLMQLPQGYLRLTVFISVPQVLMEISRLASVGLRFTDRIDARIATTGVLLSLSILAYAISYVILIPLIVGHLLLGFSSKIFLLPVLLIWLILDIFNSPLLKLIIHCRGHTKISDVNDKRTSLCPGNIFECSLFPPRSDATFNYSQYKREMKERQEKGLANRKPKNTNMVMQTLKCMVAIKRKLKKRRQASPESDVSKVNAQSDDVSTPNPEAVALDNREKIVGARLTFNINAPNENRSNCDCSEDNDECTDSRVGSDKIKQD